MSTRAAEPARCEPVAECFHADYNAPSAINCWRCGLGVPIAAGAICKQCNSKPCLCSALDLASPEKPRHKDGSRCEAESEVACGRAHWPFGWPKTAVNPAPESTPDVPGLTANAEPERYSPWKVGQLRRGECEGHVVTVKAIHRRTDLPDMWDCTDENGREWLLYEGWPNELVGDSHPIPPRPEGQVPVTHEMARTALFLPVRGDILARYINERERDEDIWDKTTCALVEDKDALEAREQVQAAEIEHLKERNRYWCNEAGEMETEVARLRAELAALKQQLDEVLLREKHDAPVWGRLEKIALELEAGHHAVEAKAALKRPVPVAADADESKGDER